jgi:hypothetical protein
MLWAVDIIFDNNNCSLIFTRLVERISVDPLTFSAKYLITNNTPQPTSHIYHIKGPQFLLSSSFTSMALVWPKLGAHPLASDADLF